jgi:hypothetical protein
MAFCCEGFTREEAQLALTCIDNELYAHARNGKSLKSKKKIRKPECYFDEDDYYHSKSNELIVDNSLCPGVKIGIDIKLPRNPISYKTPTKRRDIKTLHKDIMKSARTENRYSIFTD